ncbi:MAG: tail fiber domain-containing protein [candidate division Zixibacteria bacterium]|nr:tail fiber domain-containing protein [candidate division Zixibacteria bacterium]
MRAIRVLAVFVALLAVAYGQSAAAPLTISHQGLLTDNNGAPLNGSFSLTFSLYSVPTGGIALWTETQTVNPGDGLYQVTLGNSTPLSSALFSGANPALYLGISVGADPELTPRAEFSAAPYALHAAEVEGFSSGPGNVNTGLFSIVGGDNNTNNSDFSSILGGNDNEIDVTEFADTTFDTSGLSPFGSPPEGSLALHPPGFGTVLGGHSNIICGNHSVIVQGWQNVNCAAYSFLGTGFRNRIFGTYSTIGSGYRNEIFAPADYSVLAGGALNRGNSWTSVISGGVFNTTTGGSPSNFRGQTIGGGWRNTTDNHYSTISGGERNAASGSHATVGGGQLDSALASHSTVSGGNGNVAVDIRTSIGGGGRNRAEGQGSTVAGGEGNITFVQTHQSIGGGQDNQANGQYSTIAGGQSNVTDNRWTTVAGGSINRSINDYAVVGGGFDNTSAARSAVVSGGEGNSVFGSHSTVVGGFVNSVQADSAVIAGGVTNSATGIGSTIAGGIKNFAGFLLATIGGGTGNSSIGNATTIGGGRDNVAGPGEFATVPGGIGNVASEPGSFAAGSFAKAVDSCAYVWADCCRLPGVASPIPFKSSVSNSFNARATNGFYFLTACDSVFDPASGIGTGVYVPPGGSAWLTASHSSVKRNIRAVDETDILEKLSQLSINQWSYKTQDASIEHIGPMAEEFYAIFGVGDNDRTISSLDPAGVSLAAAKALIKENNELKDRLDRLEKLVGDLLDKN